MAKMCSKVNNDVEIRRLSPNDNHEQFLSLLNNLSPSPIYNKAVFQSILTRRNGYAATYIAVEKASGRIVGTVSMVVEEKFQRNGGVVGYLEDVVVHPEYRGRGIAKMLITYLLTAVGTKCYKIILTCKDELIPFYEQFGFMPGTAMRLSRA